MLFCVDSEFIDDIINDEMKQLLVDYIALFDEELAANGLVKRMAYNRRMDNGDSLRMFDLFRWRFGLSIHNDFLRLRLISLEPILEDNTVTLFWVAISASAVCR